MNLTSDRIASDVHVSFAMVLARDRITRHAVVTNNDVVSTHAAHPGGGHLVIRMEAIKTFPCD